MRRKHITGRVLGLSLEYPDGSEVRIVVGDRVVLDQADKKPEVAGVVTGISVPVDHAGISRIRIAPDDLDAAAKAGNSWPTSPDTSYIEVRDSGLAAHRWRPE